MAGKGHYESFLSTVSSVPINEHPDGYDTDRDGMPDVWEAANGMNPNAQDHNDDHDADGYTNLEEYLNLVDR
jgi:hypothetical protein